MLALTEGLRALGPRIQLEWDNSKKNWQKILFGFLSFYQMKRDCEFSIASARLRNSTLERFVNYCS